MAVSFDIAAKVTSTGSDASITVNLTLGGTADFLVGSIASYASVDKVTTVVWNSTEGLTERVSTPGDWTDASMWTRAAPTTGAHSMVVTFSPNATDSKLIVAGGFIGVSTTGNTANKNYLVGTQSSPVSTSITVASGGVAVDIFQIESSHPTLAASGGATQYAATTLFGGAYGGASYKLDATSMSWTFSDGGSNYIGYCVLELTPSAGGAAASLPPFRQSMRQLLSM